ncbi:MAG: hypothetical protein Q9166_004180 [cf. Caloplaca sp. 2 TL-2023]
MKRGANPVSGQNIYFYVNHPIRWIRLVGVIVAFDVYPNRITMTLDDSSGRTIEIFCKKETASAAPGICTTVDNHGAITLNKVPVQRDDEHVCTTSEGKVDLRDFDVGSVVKIKGGISEFRGEKQVTLERISLVRTTNEEAAAWVGTATFHRDILGKPWTVNEREQQRAKRKATGLDREREAKKERRRRRKEIDEQRGRKRQREQDSSRRDQSDRDAERKREAHRTVRTSKPETVRAIRHHKKEKAKHPAQPALSGNPEALKV